MNKKKSATISIKSREGNAYVYDASTNLIFSGESGFSEIVKDYFTHSREQILARWEEKYGRDNLSGNYSYIDTLVKKFDAFYFADKDGENYVYETEEEIENHLANMSQLVLEVTQACNLRCRYCVFSDNNYKDFRSHGSKHMAEEVALKSIDRFFSYVCSGKRTRKFNRIFINFYGGEPLLNFDVMKKTVEYAKNKHHREKVKDTLHFTVSTNGTLLKEDKLNYLIDNDFLLAVSLDGPETEHDKNRVTPSGKGSFDIIWNNLDKMSKKNPNYIKTHVLFLVTLNRNHDPIEIDKFFRELSGRGFSGLKVSLLRDGYSMDQGGQFREKISQLRREIFKNKSLDLSFSPFLSTLLKPLYKSIRDKKFRGSRGSYTAACPPDDFRFTVSASGEYHICERINPNFQVGNHIDGFDFENIKKLYRDYNEQVVKQKCAACLAKNTCSLCFAGAASGGRFDTSTVCDVQVKVLKGLIYDTVSILEDNPRAFKGLDPGTQSDEILDEAFY